MNCHCSALLQVFVVSSHFDVKVLLDNLLLAMGSHEAFVASVEGLAAEGLASVSLLGNLGLLHLFELSTF